LSTIEQQVLQPDQVPDGVSFDRYGSRVHEKIMEELAPIGVFQFVND
jgi:hypothetical protein